MGEAAKATADSTLDPDEEREKLMKELEILANRQDALKAMVDARKARLQELMNSSGLRSAETDYGSCFFTAKRTIGLGPESKVKKLPKKILIEGFKPSASLVDACAKAGVDLGGAVVVGAHETFTYARPKGKAATARRKDAIARSMQEAEEKVAQIMESIG